MDDHGQRRRGNNRHVQRRDQVIFILALAVAIDYWDVDEWIGWKGQVNRGRECCINVMGIIKVDLR